jgi:hypothetical protein
MAVTTQESTECENAFTDLPKEMNPVSSWGGKVQLAFFTHTQSGAGDATSSAALVKLPPGRVRVLLSLSSAYVNWTTASATLDLGWDAYTGLDGAAVAADPDGLVDGLDVDTENYYTLRAATPAAIELLGGSKVFTSKDGVVIRATSTDVAIADGDDLVGWIAYVCD